MKRLSFPRLVSEHYKWTFKQLETKTAVSSGAQKPTWLQISWGSGIFSGGSNTAGADGNERTHPGLAGSGRALLFLTVFIHYNLCYTAPQRAESPIIVPVHVLASEKPSCDVDVKPEVMLVTWLFLFNVVGLGYKNYSKLIAITIITKINIFYVKKKNLLFLDKYTFIL